MVLDCIDSWSLSSSLLLKVPTPPLVLKSKMIALLYLLRSHISMFRELFTCVVLSAFCV